MRLLGIAGSLRAGSYNRQLLQLAAENLPDGVEYAVWDSLRDLPAYDEDEENTASFAVAGFRSAVAEADAVLVVTPEYNGSIPGALKNALDWGSRPPDNAASGVSQSRRSVHAPARSVVSGRTPRRARSSA